MAFGSLLKKKDSGPIRKKVNLALQGGGAHGAFTWGVLDALLSDPRLEIEGISGTSAGAMNGAIVAGALAQTDGHDADKARAAVARLPGWKIEGAP